MAVDKTKRVDTLGCNIFWDADFLQGYFEFWKARVANQLNAQDDDEEDGKTKPSSARNKTKMIQIILKHLLSQQTSSATTDQEYMKMVSCEKLLKSFNQFFKRKIDNSSETAEKLSATGEFLYVKHLFILIFKTRLTK